MVEPEAGSPTVARPSPLPMSPASPDDRHRRRYYGAPVPTTFTVTVTSPARPPEPLLRGLPQPGAVKATPPPPPRPRYTAVRPSPREVHEDPATYVVPRHDVDRLSTVDRSVTVARLGTVPKLA
jgi:hypothetical protein